MQTSHCSYLHESEELVMEWIQTANNKTAKQENSEITNSGKQNDDHYKTANTTKERTFVKNGELTI